MRKISLSHSVVFFLIKKNLSQTHATPQEQQLNTIITLILNETKKSFREIKLEKYFHFN